MKRLAILAALALAACQTEEGGDAAARRYEFAQREGLGDQAELCQLAREAARAYMNEGDASHYLQWSLIRDKDCR